jgi:D-3-phosphoglycerate dehydrogenase
MADNAPIGQTHRFKVRTLDNISVKGLRRLPREHYEIASDMTRPDAILLRSHRLQQEAVADSVLAVARAGAGVNNIPVQALSARGIAVFNTPGANANAVKELVIAGLLMAARNLPQAWRYVRELDGADPGMEGAVEAGKKRYVGFELPGRTLGVIGLGAIGVEVANTALALGMQVIGYDPQISVHRAWQLSSGVQQALSLDDMFARSELISVHVPLMETTRHLINAARLSLMPAGGVVVNLARGEIVDSAAVLAALERGHLHALVTDFPCPVLKDHLRVIALPHLGASTREAEENCAAMAADELREFLEHGNIRNSVNFPEARLARNGRCRLTVANINVPNMVGQISTALAAAGINIADLLNQSRGELAYTIVDLDAPLPAQTLRQIRAISGVLSARMIPGTVPAGDAP